MYIQLIKINYIRKYELIENKITKGMESLKENKHEIEFECAICMGIMVEPCSLRPHCSHTFCI